MFEKTTWPTLTGDIESMLYNRIMDGCFHGGNRNGTMILFNTNQNSQHVIPTTKQAIQIPI